MFHRRLLLLSSRLRGEDGVRSTRKLSSTALRERGRLGYSAYDAYGKRASIRRISTRPGPASRPEDPVKQVLVCFLPRPSNENDAAPSRCVRHRSRLCCEHRPGRTSRRQGQKRCGRSADNVSHFGYSVGCRKYSDRYLVRAKLSFTLIYKFD